MSTTVWESYHLRVPIGKVWELVKPATFAYLPTVVTSETKTPLSEVGSHRIVTYKDGTVQKIRITGISESDHSISWELEESAPSTSFTAQTHTVRLRRVTDGDTTFVEWNTEFSIDAKPEVLQDAKFKQADNFSALAVALGVPPSQPRLTLTYFGGRGRAEVSRLLMNQAGLVFDDVRVTSEQWAEKKKTGFAPFGQLPCLTVDGKTFAESGAIERYLAKLGGLAGANSGEWAEIDGLTQAINDVAPKFVEAVSPYQNKTEEEKIPKITAYFATDGVFYKWMPFFAKALTSNKGGAGFLVGSKVTYADIALFNFLQNVKSVKKDCLSPIPVLEGWYTRVASLPRIDSWIKTRPKTPM